MRLSWVASSGFAAYVCASWASGIVPQTVFTPDHIWLWWLPAFTWTVTAFRTAMGERG